MNLVPYTLTALSRQDIPDTPQNRNIVVGAVVTCTNALGANVTMFDDADGANGSTAKQTGVNGQVTVFVEPDEYTFTVNGRPSKVVVGNPKQVSSVASVEALRLQAGRFNGQQISLSGYYAGSTKGAGMFVWDATSTAADDGGVTIAVAGVATGRWTRQIEGFVTPEMFGAIANQNAVDPVPAILAAADYSAAFNCEVRFIDKYALHQELFLRGDAAYYSTKRAEFYPAVAGINGVTFMQGNAHGKSIMPRIANFSSGYGFRLLGSRVSDIYIPLISGCKDSLVYECIFGNVTTSKILDTKVTVGQIGNTERCIVVRVDNKDCVIQGNELYVNFVNGFSSSVIEWVTTGAAAATDWDSNKVQFQAIDPLPFDNTTFFKNANPTGVAVDRWTIICDSWCGEITTNTCLASGVFNDLDLRLNLAQNLNSINNCQVVGSNNKLNLGNDIDTPLSPAVVVSPTANNLSGFNSGVPVWKKRVKMSFTLPVAIGANQTRPCYVYHMSADRRTLFRVTPSDAGSMAGFVLDRCSDNSATTPKEIILTWRNLSGTTATEGTVIHFYLEQVGV